MPQQPLLLSTTGTNTEVVLRDLGGRKFSHPTTDFDLYKEFEEEDLANSVDLQNALDSGWVIIKTSNNNSISAVGEATIFNPDYLNVGFIPTSYIRDVTGGESIQDLGAHLKGIDNKLGSIISGNVDVDNQKARVVSIVTTQAIDWVDIAGDGHNNLIQLETVAGSTRNYFIQFTGDFSVSKNTKNMHLRINVDGTGTESTEPYFRFKNQNRNVTIGDTTEIGPSKLVKVQWKADQGSTLKCTSGRLIIHGVG
jgi:hypothetical protein